MAAGAGVRVALPEGWADRTALTIVGPPGAAGEAPSLVVTRDALPPGADVHWLARAHDRALRSSGVCELALVATGRAAVAGVPALVRTYRWRLGERSLRQRLWCLATGGDGYTVTASAPDADFDAVEAELEAAVAALRLG